MTFKKKRVLVTGAGGFIGKHICKALFKEDATVVGMVRSEIDSKYLSEQYVVDITNEIVVRQIINEVKPEYVVHLASNKNRGDNPRVYSEAYRNNLIGSLNIINACQNNPMLVMFVALGSTDEYGKLRVPFRETEKEAPINAYGASKLAVTELLRTLGRTTGFPSLILRPSIVYGPGQDSSMFLPAFIRTLVQGQPFDMSLGEQTRDFIYVDDLVKAIIQGLRVPSLTGDVVNISSATPIRIDAVARTSARMLGNNAEDLIKLGAKDYRSGDIMKYWADNTLANDLIGWSPTVSFEEGLKLTIDAIKAEVQS